MDTMTGFMLGQLNAHREPMVFDWNKAAQIIAERKPEVASAGLRDDWGWTGGTIWRDGQPVTDEYTFLSSKWAVPELDIDGEVIECFRMQSEVPDWNSATKWPASAMEIVGHAPQSPEAT